MALTDEQKKAIERDIQTIAKGIYSVAVRNGPIEVYHAEGRPIGQKEMEAINRYAYNVLCCLLKWFAEQKSEEFVTVCEFASRSLCYFDPPDYDSAEVQDLYNFVSGRISKYEATANQPPHS